MLQLKPLRCQRLQQRHQSNLTMPLRLLLQNIHWQLLHLQQPPLLLPQLQLLTRRSQKLLLLQRLQPIHNRMLLPMLLQHRLLLRLLLKPQRQRLLLKPQRQRLLLHHHWMKLRLLLRLNILRRQLLLKLLSVLMSLPPRRQLIPRLLMK
jgi:hypothetical protein